MLTLQQPTYGMDTIGVDLDDTLADFSSTAIYIMKQVSLTPEKVTMENWTDWDIAKCFGTVCDAALTEAMRDPRMWLSLAPFETVGRVMAKLMQNYKIHIVSYRPEKFYDITRGWLVLHEIPFDSLDLVVARSDKLRVAREHGISAFIDDNQELCESLRDMGLIVGQVERPWNVGGPGIVRSSKIADVSTQVVKLLEGRNKPKNTLSLF